MKRVIEIDATTDDGSYSLYLEPNTFGFVERKMPGGWTAIHVIVDTHSHRPDHPQEILVSRDAQDEADIDLHIDELISLLDDLRPKMKRRMLQLRRRSNR